MTCGGAGFALARIVRFPAQPLPTAIMLDDAGVGMVAVFAGDGTVNALVTQLAGWSGTVLVLPGGTMNLLFHRLHGEREADEVIRLAAAGEAKAVRPGVIACRAGTALADLLAGPGTRWYEVREAMREADVLAVAGNAAQALGETLATPGIVCREPAVGRRSRRRGEEQGVRDERPEQQLRLRGLRRQPGLFKTKSKDARRAAERATIHARRLHRFQSPYAMVVDDLHNLRTVPTAHRLRAFEVIDQHEPASRRLERLASRNHPQQLLVGVDHGQRVRRADKQRAQVLE